MYIHHHSYEGSPRPPSSQARTDSSEPTALGSSERQCIDVHAATDTRSSSKCGVTKQLTTPSTTAMTSRHHPLSRTSSKWTNRQETGSIASGLSAREKTNQLLHFEDVVIALGVYRIPSQLTENATGISNCLHDKVCLLLS